MYPKETEKGLSQAVLPSKVAVKWKWKWKSLSCLQLFAIPRNFLIKTRWPLSPREWQPHRVGSVRCSDGGGMGSIRCDGWGGEHWWQRRWAHKSPGALPGKKLKVTSYWSFPKATMGWESVSYTSEGFLAYSLTVSLMFPAFQAFSLFLCCLRSPAPPFKSLRFPRVCVHSHLSRVRFFATLWAVAC